jgi:hypothetical protein
MPFRGYLRTDLRIVTPNVDWSGGHLPEVVYQADRRNSPYPEEDSWDLAPWEHSCWVVLRVKGSSGSERGHRTYTPTRYGVTWLDIYGSPERQGIPVRIFEVMDWEMPGKGWIKCFEALVREADRRHRANALPADFDPLSRLPEVSLESVFERYIKRTDARDYPNEAAIFATAALKTLPLPTNQGEFRAVLELAFSAGVHFAEKDKI